MIKWLLRLIIVGFFGIAGLGLYGLYRGGYFVLPDLAEDEYAISFKNGFRAIVREPNPTNSRAARNSDLFRRLVNAHPDRRYRGLDMVVPSWLEDQWSRCEQAPEGQSADRTAIENSMPEDMRREFALARLDYYCTVTTDGETVLRGVIYSVPRD